MQLDTTITLTRSELIELVRKAYHEIKNIREVKIVEDDVREWLNKRTEDESNDWIDVPNDWSKPYCPTDCKIVDVEVRGGWKDISIDATEHDIGWVQEDCKWDIVKYRVVR